MNRYVLMLRKKRISHGGQTERSSTRSNRTEDGVQQNHREIHCGDSLFEYLAAAVDAMATSLALQLEIGLYNKIV
ncbi:MAG: hypothetical protein ACREO5_03700 [Candidatus Binatia bacterium]